MVVNLIANVLSNTFFLVNKPFKSLCISSLLYFNSYSKKCDKKKEVK